jgi:hypothetical protein
MKKRILKIICLIAILSLIIPSLSTTSNAEILTSQTKPTIKVAFTWQKWDILDNSLSKIYMKIYEKHLNKGEKKYNVTFEIYEYWDNLESGDIQNGKLESQGIDILVGPGGFGAWNCPSNYRAKIKQFIEAGGGFYGICGDSTLGTLGFKNLPEGYKEMLNASFGYDDFTPMLGLVNVYMDASFLDQLFKNPERFNKLVMIKIILLVGLSRGTIKVRRNLLTVQKEHFGKNIRVQMGSPPLVNGPLINRLIMSRVYTIAVFKNPAKPYNYKIIGEKAVVAAKYKDSRIILSTPHPELAFANKKSGDFFTRNILWCAKQLTDN